jgi:putative ATP-dependent endonuclease of OLD family
VEITRVLIKNFRSIKDADIILSPTTVFIGPNNIGKTAILDAIRIALSRRWGRQGTGEFDRLIWPTSIV